MVWNDNTMDPEPEALAHLRNNFNGAFELFNPQRWHLVMPALAQWCQFVALHNAAAVCVSESSVLDQAMLRFRFQAYGPV